MLDPGVSTLALDWGFIQLTEQSGRSSRLTSALARYAAAKTTKRGAVCILLEENRKIDL